MASTIPLDKIVDFQEEQIKLLVKRTTNAWYTQIITRRPENLGTPKDTGDLRKAWQIDISEPYTGKIFNSLEYAEPVIYGSNLPASWQGQWRTRCGATQGFPDLLGLEVARKSVPKLMRAIAKGR